MKPPALPLVLLRTPLAICRLAYDAPVPDWTAGATSFLTISRTKDELSIVADEASVPANVPGERGYRALKVVGPLPLNLIGILAAIASPLAEAKLAIFAISTFETDYVLVKGKDLDAAVIALTGAGHQIELE